MVARGGEYAQSWHLLFCPLPYIIFLSRSVLLLCPRTLSPLSLLRNPSVNPLTSVAVVSSSGSPPRAGRVAAACPSGRLVVWDSPTGETWSADLAPDLRRMPSGVWTGIAGSCFVSAGGTNYVLSYQLKYGILLHTYYTIPKHNGCPVA